MYHIFLYTLSTIVSYVSNKYHCISSAIKLLFIVLNKWTSPSFNFSVIMLPASNGYFDFGHVFLRLLLFISPTAYG